MRTYARTMAIYIGGLLLSCLALAFSVAYRVPFVPTFSFLALLYFVIRLFQVQTRLVESWRQVVDSLQQQDLSQMAHAPFKDWVIRELSADLSEAITTLRGRLVDEEAGRQYYEKLLNQVDTAVLVTGADDRVEWRNRAAGEWIAEGERLPEALRRAIGERRSVVEQLQLGSFPSDWAIEVVPITWQGRSRRIVSLKDIHSALERNEMEAWRKLIRVLTHEIMNSITPVISLAETLSVRFDTTSDDVIRQGLDVIHRRSQGLLDFVENYRRLTRVAPPAFQPLRVSDLFADLRRLCPEPYLIFRLSDPNLAWRADRSQMEQVFLNLLKNAREACAEKADPEIVVEATGQSGALLFVVRDNGVGILPEVLERIFIPFFTTKPSGSGIGLSLCKQIVTAHGGRIAAESTYGEGCRFTLRFPK